MPICLRRPLSVALPELGNGVLCMLPVPHSVLCAADLLCWGLSGCPVPCDATAQVQEVAMNVNGVLCHVSGIFRECLG